MYGCRYGQDTAEVKSSTEKVTHWHEIGMEKVWYCTELFFGAYCIFG